MVNLDVAARRGGVRRVVVDLDVAGSMWQARRVIVNPDVAGSTLTCQVRHVAFGPYALWLDRNRRCWAVIVVFGP